MYVYQPHFIQLTTGGSATVRIAATAGVIDDSSLSLWVECDHRVWKPGGKTSDPERTAYALTADQARKLGGQIQLALKLENKAAAR